jgi:hypothetical protein
MTYAMQSLEARCGHPDFGDLGADGDHDVRPEPPADLGNGIVSVSARIAVYESRECPPLGFLPEGFDDVVLLFPGHRRCGSAVPGHQGTPPVNFKLGRRAMQFLSPFFRPGGGTAIVCAVVIGELRVKKNFRTRNASAGPAGNGFGTGVRRQLFLRIDDNYFSRLTTITFYS